MNDFDSLLLKMPALLDTLQNSIKYMITCTKDFPKKPGVYLLSENNTPIYVGKTGNIYKRMQHHRSNSSSQATLAIKFARIETGKPASYKKDSGLRQLMKNPEFITAFENARRKIRKLECKFVEIDDDNTQYLFEFFTAMKLETKYNNFGNT